MDKNITHRCSLFFINNDYYLDKIPIISTFTNLTYLFQKFYFFCDKSSSSSKTRFARHIQDKSIIRSTILCIPFIGNIIVIVLDKKKPQQRAPLPPKKIEKDREKDRTPNPSLEPKVQSIATARNTHPIKQDRLSSLDSDEKLKGKNPVPIPTASQTAPLNLQSMADTIEKTSLENKADSIITPRNTHPNKQQILSSLDSDEKLKGENPVPIPTASQTAPLNLQSMADTIEKKFSEDDELFFYQLLVEEPKNLKEAKVVERFITLLINKPNLIKHFNLTQDHFRAILEKQQELFAYFSPFQKKNAVSFLDAQNFQKEILDKKQFGLFSKDQLISYIEKNPKEIESISTNELSVRSIDEDDKDEIIKIAYKKNPISLKFFYIQATHKCLYSILQEALKKDNFLQNPLKNEINALFYLLYYKNSEIKPKEPIRDDNVVKIVERYPDLGGKTVPCDDSFFCLTSDGLTRGNYEQSFIPYSLLQQKTLQSILKDYNMRSLEAMNMDSESRIQNIVKYGNPIEAFKRVPECYATQYPDQYVNLASRASQQNPLILLYVMTPHTYSNATTSSKWLSIFKTASEKNSKCLQMLTPELYQKDPKTADEILKAAIEKDPKAAAYMCYCPEKLLEIAVKKNIEIFTRYGVGIYSQCCTKAAYDIDPYSLAACSDNIKKAIDWDRLQKEKKLFFR